MSTQKIDKDRNTSVPQDKTRKSEAGGRIRPAVRKTTSVPQDGTKVDTSVPQDNP